MLSDFDKIKIKLMKWDVKLMNQLHKKTAKSVRSHDSREQIKFVLEHLW